MFYIHFIHRNSLAPNTTSEQYVCILLLKLNVRNNLYKVDFNLIVILSIMLCFVFIYTLIILYFCIKILKAHF